MAKATLPTPEELRQLLRYVPETGKLYWLEKPESVFGKCRSTSIWNATVAGREAFTASNRGYKVGAVNKVMVKAHRVIMALVHGYWPPDEVDHLNRDRSDNRLCNLRFASRAENLANTEAPSSDARALLASSASARKSRFIGVTKTKSNRWQAHIRFDGKQHYLGCFDTEDEAACAYDAASRTMRGQASTAVNFAD